MGRDVDRRQRDLDRPLDLTTLVIVGAAFVSCVRLTIIIIVGKGSAQRRSSTHPNSSRRFPLLVEVESGAYTLVHAEERAVFVLVDSETGGPETAHALCHAEEGSARALVCLEEAGGEDSSTIPELVKMRPPKNQLAEKGEPGDLSNTTPPIPTPKPTTDKRMQTTEWRRAKRPHAADAARSAVKQARIAPVPPAPTSTSPQPLQHAVHVGPSISVRAETDTGGRVSLVSEIVQEAIDEAVRTVLDDILCNEHLDHLDLTSSIIDPEPDMIACFSLELAAQQFVPHESQMPSWMEAEEYATGQLL